MVIFTLNYIKQNESAFRVLLINYARNNLLKLQSVSLLYSSYCVCVCTDSKSKDKNDKPLRNRPSRWQNLDGSEKSQSHSCNVNYGLKNFGSNQDQDMRINR